MNARKNGAYLISRLNERAIYGFLQGQRKMYLIMRCPYGMVMGFVNRSFIVNATELGFQLPALCGQLLVLFWPNSDTATKQWHQIDRNVKQAAEISMLNFSEICDFCERSRGRATTRMRKKVRG